MLISRKLRESNIAEYVLYMWQVEDLLRAYGCDPSRIEREYLPRFKADAATMQEMARWYADLCRMMRSEGAIQGGHLQINKNVVAELSELSQRLIESPRFQRYQAAYRRALPDIMELRRRGAGALLTDVEICFNALYGAMLLRMKKADITPATQAGLGEISTLMGLLAAYYKQNRERPLRFDDSEEQA